MTTLQQDLDALIEKHGFVAVVAAALQRKSWQKRGRAIEMADRSLVDEIHWLNRQFSPSTVHEFVNRIWVGEDLR